MHRIFERFEVNISVVGMLLGACLLLVGMIAGEVAFNDVAGIGVVYALGVGLVCAVCGGGIEPTFVT